MTSPVQQAESISLALQVEYIGFTRETAIEKVAARLQTELKLTAQQAIDLAKVVKANWKDLPFIAKTFPAVDYEQLFPFERIQKQMELLRSLGPEWTAYFQTIQKGAAGAEASFANFNNIMLMENAMAAKKQIDQMEKRREGLIGRKCRSLQNVLRSCVSIFRSILTKLTNGANQVDTGFSDLKT